MNIIKILLFTILSFSFSESYHISSSVMTRKTLVKFVGCTAANIMLKKNVIADDNNPPLSPEEMEEYNRLLKEAERIQAIIDANKNALINEENGVKKYLQKKKEGKLPIIIMEEEHENH